jgi:hypothetical protein
MPARTLPPDPQMPWPDAQAVPGRVLVAGDSTMFHLYKYFPHAIYPDVTVDGPMRVGCGFVDLPYVRNEVVADPQECSGWLDEWPEDVEGFAPDVAVLGSIVWDGFDRALSTGTFGPGSPEFDEAFVSAYRQAIDRAGRNGEIPVYVVGQPCLASDIDVVLNDPQRSAHIDGLMQAAVKRMPNARFVDTRSMTCDGANSASDSDSKGPLREDGVHWSQRGADVLWSTVLNQTVADQGGSQ